MTANNWPGEKVQIADRRLRALGYRQYSPTGVTALDPPADTDICFIQALTQNIRYRDDGGGVTTVVGMQIADGDTVPFIGDFSAFRMIEEAGGAQVNVSFYAFGDQS